MFVLSNYLRRIGFQGEARPDFETLTKVIHGHSCSIPFEHIDVLSGVPIDLSHNAIAFKLVDSKRGGYCFEQNGLLLHALLSIGFEAQTVAARVRLQTPREVLPRRTHMFVQVLLNGESWIVDAGFGGYSLTAPIRWQCDIEQATPHETRRITFEDGKYFHQALRGESWQDLCEFTNEAMPEVDQEVANWFTSTCPWSKFMNSLSVGLARPDGTRYAILNNRFTHRSGETILEQRTIPDKAALRDLLTERFGIMLTESSSFGGWPFTQA